MEAERRRKELDPVVKVVEVCLAPLFLSTWIQYVYPKEDLLAMSWQE